MGKLGQRDVEEGEGRERAPAAAPAALLYCLDSHSYPATKRLGTYAWLTLDQVQWYRERSRAYTAANGACASRP